MISTLKNEASMQNPSATSAIFINLEPEVLLRQIFNIIIGFSFFVVLCHVHVLKPDVREMRGRNGKNCDWSCQDSGGLWQCFSLYGSVMSQITSDQSQREIRLLAGLPLAARVVGVECLLCFSVSISTYAFNVL